MCVKKKCTKQLISPLHCSWGLETFQGVTLDSLGAGVIENGRIYAPDCPRRRQEAPRCVQATLAAFLHFLHFFLQEGLR